MLLIYVQTLKLGKFQGVGMGSIFDCKKEIPGGRGVLDKCLPWGGKVMDIFWNYTVLKPFPERRAIAHAHLRTRLKSPRRAIHRTPKQTKTC